MKGPFRVPTESLVSALTLCQLCRVFRHHDTLSLLSLTQPDQCHWLSSAPTCSPPTVEPGALVSEARCSGCLSFESLCCTVSPEGKGQCHQVVSMAPAWCQPGPTMIPHAAHPYRAGFWNGALVPSSLCTCCTTSLEPLSYSSSFSKALLSPSFQTKHSLLQVLFTAGPVSLLATVPTCSTLYGLCLLRVSVL